MDLFSKCNAPDNPSNVEDCHRLISTKNTSQKVIIKLSKRKDVYRVLKAKPSLKNVDLNGTGIPPDTPTFVNQSPCKYYKFLSSKCKNFWLNKVVESFWVSKSSFQIRLLDKSIKVITHFDDLKVLFPEIQSWKKIQVVHKYEWYMIFYI